MAPRHSKRRSAKPRNRVTPAAVAPKPQPKAAETTAPLGSTPAAREPWSRWAFALLVLIVAVFQVLLGLLEYLLQHDNLVFDLVNPQSVPLVVSFAVLAPLARVIAGERRMGIIEGLAAGFFVGICLTLAEFVGYPLLVGGATTQAPPSASASASPGSAGVSASASPQPSPRATPSPASPSPTATASAHPSPGGPAAAATVVPPESVQLEAVAISNIVGYIVSVLLYPTVFKGWLIIWRGKGADAPGRKKPPLWRRIIGGGG